MSENKEKELYEKYCDILKKIHGKNPRKGFDITEELNEIYSNIEKKWEILCHIQCYIQRMTMNGQ